MTFRSDIHRNVFGTIDFDHYRRVAAHMRTETMRAAVRGAADALGHIAAAAAARLRRSTSPPVWRRTVPSR